MFTLKIVGLLLKSTFEAKIHIDTSLTYKREKHIIIYMDEFNNSDSSIIIIKAIKFSSNFKEVQITWRMDQWTRRPSVSLRRQADRME